MLDKPKAELEIVMRAAEDAARASLQKYPNLAKHGVGLDVDKRGLDAAIWVSSLKRAGMKKQILALEFLENLFLVSERSIRRSAIIRKKCPRAVELIYSGRMGATTAEYIANGNWDGNKLLIAWECAPEAARLEFMAMTGLRRTDNG